MKKKWLGLPISLMIICFSTVSAAQVMDTNRIDRLNRELEQAISSEDWSRAVKLTDLLIQEFTEYRTQLQQRINSTENPDKIPPSQSRFGRELVLEASVAYTYAQGICVQGKIRNSSRSQIDLPVYAIADFYSSDNRYLGSNENQIVPRPILPDRIGTFAIATSGESKVGATTVRLRFRGVNSEGSVTLNPTAKAELILPVRKNNTYQKCGMDL